jgi:hypothetical protein
MASESQTRRKRNSADLEALILAERAAPRASVAMSRGIDANVVHAVGKWTARAVRRW